MKTLNLQIDLRGLVLALVIVVAAFLLWEVRIVLLIFFGAFALSAALKPLILSLESREVPRWLAITIVYITMLALAAGIILFLVTQLSGQLQLLINSLPTALDKLHGSLSQISPQLAQMLNLPYLALQLQNPAELLKAQPELAQIFAGDNLLVVTRGTLGLLGGAVGVFVGLFTLIILSIYILARKEPLITSILKLLKLAKPASLRMEKLLNSIEVSLGAWVGGQLTLMIFIGVLTYLIVSFPGIFDPNYVLDDFALPLAIIAGLLEGLPNLGPTLSGLILGLIALGTSGVGSAAYIVIVSGLLQNFEAVFLVPQVMRKAVGLDPILTVLTVLAGLQLGGVIGALVAVPIMAVLKLIVLEFIHKDTVNN